MSSFVKVFEGKKWTFWTIFDIFEVSVKSHCLLTNFHKFRWNFIFFCLTVLHINRIEPSPSIQTVVGRTESGAILNKWPNSCL